MATFTTSKAALTAPAAPAPVVTPPAVVRRQGGVDKPVTLWVRQGGVSKQVTVQHRPAVTTATPAADDQAVFANPGRGLTIPQESHWKTPYASNFWALSNPLASWASHRADGDTVCFRQYYLDELNTANATVPQALRDYLTADMTYARQQGLKLVVRFAYKNGVDPVGSTPYQDTPGVATVLAHMDVLLPLLDPAVVHVLQAGFIGLWGERYYTDLTTSGNMDQPSAADWEQRAVMLDRTLARAPGIPVALRYVGEVEHYIASRPNLAKADLARITLHNDALSGVDSAGGDYGTYTIASANGVGANKAWVAARAATQPFGGEIGSYMTSSWAHAQAEMSLQRASYLNSAQILSGWDTTVLRRQLGYRLTATKTTFTPPVAGQRCQVTVTLTNTGWAAPTPARPIIIELVNGSTTVQAVTDVTTTALQPGTTATATATLALPANAPSGSWRVRAWLPDPNAALRDNPAYAIRLANAGVWDAATGRNTLTTI